MGLLALGQVRSAMSITCDVPWDSRGRDQATFKISTVRLVVLYYTALIPSEEGIPKHKGKFRPLCLSEKQLVGLLYG